MTHLHYSFTFVL